MNKMFLICLLSCLHLSIFQVACADEGHKAGREWAEREGIYDPGDCRITYPGRWTDDNNDNSGSFTEGCLEFLREQGITNDEDETLAEDDDAVTFTTSEDEDKSKPEQNPQSDNPVQE